MGNVMAYSGLTTKIRAMQAKLLTQADYETISGFTDVVQVVEFLKTKPAYAVYMDQLELAHLHRGDIEKMLYQSLYNDYTRIFRFAGIDQKKFLKIYWKKYEVSVINYCLRIVFNHYDKPYDLDYKKYSLEGTGSSASPFFKVSDHCRLIDVKYSSSSAIRLPLGMIRLSFL